MNKGKESEKLKELFSKYIAPKKILIADPAAGSRVGIARTLIDMGATSSNITMASSYETAEQEMAKIKPQVVFCDFALGNRCGLDLLQAQRTASPEAKDSLFVLVTGNSSQSAVAQAAEEDVDTFILKPYTIEVFRQVVMRAAVNKAYPSDYQKTIDAGKKLLLEGKPDEAKVVFEKAMTLNEKPSLACFYHGQAEMMKQLMDAAEGSYSKGLQYNKIHYKCMAALCDLLMQRKMHKEAYDMIKKISRYFPANPKRLASVLRLAIMTKNYEDIERYYQLFKNLDDRNEELIRYVCAALVVCGKYYLQNASNARALELFQKASVTASGRTKILREIIQSLIDSKLPKEAKEFLSSFPAHTHKQQDYLASHYLVQSHFLPASKVVEEGRALIAQQVQDPTIYRVLIRHSLAAGLKSAAETLALQAAKAFPDQKQAFLKIVENIDNDNGEAA